MDSIFPIEYGAEYSCEEIPFKDMRILFGDGTNPMFEWVSVKPKFMIQDDFARVVGQDLFEIPMHTGLALGIVGMIGGDNLPDELGGTVEKKLDEYLNNIKGLKHTGCRDSASLQVSYEFTKKYRFADLGQFLIKKIKEDFPEIERAEFKFVVAFRQIPQLLEAARRDYAKRDSKQTD